MSASNADVVQSMYAAFGRGDVAFIMAGLADDIEWDVFNFSNHGQLSGVETLKARRGKDAVAGFFTALMAEYDAVSVAPVNVLTGGSQVAVVVRASLTCKATGRKYESDTGACCARAV